MYSTYLQCKSKITSQSFPSDFRTPPFHLLSEPHHHIQNLLDWIEIFSIFAPILSNVNIHRDVFPKEFRTYSAGYGGQRGREVLQFKTKTYLLVEKRRIRNLLAGYVTIFKIRLGKKPTKSMPCNYCLQKFAPYQGVP